MYQSSRFLVFCLFLIRLTSTADQVNKNIDKTIIDERLNIFQWLFGPVIQYHQQPTIITTIITSNGPMPIVGIQTITTTTSTTTTTTMAMTTTPKPKPTPTSTTTNLPISSTTSAASSSTSAPPSSTTVEVEIEENCDNCTCGLKNVKNRIVGGQETKVNEYPWMVLLLYNERFYCGASLINSRFVVTAAHCTVGFQKERILVRLLEHDRKTTNESKTIDRKVSEIIRHENYSNRNFDNDIALLKLNRNIQFDNVLRPVCLPSTSNNSYAGYEGIVTGWGAVNQSGPVATSLNEVTVPILSHEECSKSGYGSKRITKNMICAGFKKGGMDSCQGDSGGPMHVSTDKQHNLVGIVSWGEGCAKPNYPGVYARVGNYIDWIRNKTTSACYCDSKALH